jgi:16S rRNA (guanine(1405)-N(7))-methyltransferase
MLVSEQSLNELIQQVCKSAKYANIDESLVCEIVKAEAPKWKNAKEVVKSTRNKLHQVGSAFQESTIPYGQWITEISQLPESLSCVQTTAFINRCLPFHSSTAERQPFISTFFTRTLAPIQPVESILDLACGFTPLCIPWIPTASDIKYTGIDIYSDMISFLDLFFTHFKLNHEFETINIIDNIPQQTTQVTFLLKTIPCLEQVDKSIGTRLLESIRSENILVSFPSRSLGGRPKGMAVNYETHFNHLIEGHNWRVTKTEFPNEIAFLIQK